MIAELEQALQRLVQVPRAEALLGRFEPCCLTVLASETVAGASTLLAHAPLGGMPDPPSRDDLEKLLKEGKLRGWLTCQSEAFLIDGAWQHQTAWGAVLDADLALGDTIGLQIRHLGDARWSVTTVVEHPTTSGKGRRVLAEDVGFLRQDPGGARDLLLTYRRYWDVTADGLAFTAASRLVAIDRKAPG